MDLISSIPAMQAAADAARAGARRLALVPTMGALHAGHLALVQDARRRAGPDGHVCVSIFVNPTQFGPGEDFEAYPRTLDADTEALRSVGGVDAVFAPSAAEMYPFGLPPYATVAVRDLDRHLCGARRPGHFAGVTSVVTKLFLACRPHVAVFGEKDAQQLAILRRMTAEMGFGIDVAGHPIVRESDGLAMSSRNRYLSAEERLDALALSRAVFAAEARIRDGERSGARLEDAMRAAMESSRLVRVDYAQVVDALALQPVETLVEDGPSQGRYLCAVAAVVGTTRLIDNVTVGVGE